jgi:hypothetical protein
MAILSYKKGQLAHTLFICLALTIVLDFILPGHTYSDRIIDVKKELEQYYNAAGNYHYSYRVFTPDNDFVVSEEFAQTVKENQEIQYEVSLVFGEVNSYGLLTSESNSIYVLRILSGLILPLLAIVVLVLGYKYGSKMSILVFVIQVLLLADLIFLMI